MGHDDRRNGTDLDGSPRCPRCGSVLSARLLEVEDEGEPETLLLVDCPNGDFHTTVTRRDIVMVLAAEVRVRLGF